MTPQFIITKYVTPDILAACTEWAARVDQHNLQPDDDHLFDAVLAAEDYIANLPPFTFNDTINKLIVQYSVFCPDLDEPERIKLLELILILGAVLVGNFATVH